MVLSKDKKRFYLTNSLEEVEILDIATRKSIDHFSMSEGATSGPTSGAWFRIRSIVS